MNAAYWGAVAGRYEVPAKTEGLLDDDEVYPGEITHSEILFKQAPEHIDSLNGSNDRISYAKAAIPTGAAWLRATAAVKTPEKEWDVWKMPQFIVQLRGNGHPVKTALIRISRQLAGGEEREIGFDVKVPPHTDSVFVIFWNGGSTKSAVVYRSELSAIK